MKICLSYQWLKAKLLLLITSIALANLLGLVALFRGIVLAATSSDYAVRKLGGRSWKRLHMAGHVIFYIIAIHVAYFIFIRFRTKFYLVHTKLLFLLMLFILWGLQFSAYWKGIRQQKGVSELKR